MFENAVLYFVALFSYLICNFKLRDSMESQAVKSLGCSGCLIERHDEQRFANYSILYMWNTMTIIGSFGRVSPNLWGIRPYAYPFCQIRIQQFQVSNARTRASRRRWRLDCLQTSACPSYSSQWCKQLLISIPSRFSCSPGSLICTIALYFTWETASGESIRTTWLLTP